MSNNLNKNLSSFSSNLIVSNNDNNDNNNSFEEEFPFEWCHGICYCRCGYRG
jgi:hypothetical protein